MDTVGLLHYGVLGVVIIAGGLLADLAKEWIRARALRRQIEAEPRLSDAYQEIAALRERMEGWVKPSIDAFAAIQGHHKAARERWDQEMHMEELLLHDLTEIRMKLIQIMERLPRRRGIDET